MNYKDVINELGSLIDEKSSKEQIEKITQLKTKIEMLESDNTKLSSDYVELKKDYAQTIREFSFDKPLPEVKEQPSPKNEFEILNEILNNRK